jgi:hypothetical protein
LKFTFSVPVWGDWHCLQYLKHVLPSHAAAELEGRYVIHTTALGKRMLQGKPEHELPRCEVEYIEINPQASYFQFSDYHQEAFDSSEVCMFLQADAMLSAGTFKAIRKAVDEGYKHVNVCGINAVDDGSPIPYGEGFNEWGVKHLIPTLRGNIWGTSDSMMSPQTLYFQDGEAFWCHAFHHDPICIVNDKRGMSIRDSTLDWISPTFFTPAETTVLSGHDALVIEISPPQKFDRHPRMKYVNATEIAMKVKQLVLPSHTNLFRYAVPILGESTQKYRKMIDDVVAIMSAEAFGARKVA